MNEEEARKIIEYNTQDYYIDISWEECDEFKKAISTFIKLYEEEKEKNKELVKVIKNVREMHDVKCKVIDMMAEDYYNYYIARRTFRLPL